nr:putative ribonuclease H-like domain-containing protein [Tanacetum cinerariifolium]
GNLLLPPSTKTKCTQIKSRANKSEDGNPARANVKQALGRGSYALSWKPCQRDSLNLSDHRLHDDLKVIAAQVYYKDAKSLFAAVETRFGGNEAKKKTQKTLLKKMYKNFSALSTKSFDSIFNRLQKIESQLAILDIMSIDDLYNNFKIVKQEVKRTAISNSSSQNMAFVSSPGTNITNEVHTTYGVSTASTQIVHEDLKQIHKDDLEEMDLKCQLALLSMRANRFLYKTRKKITINGSDIVGFNKSKVECYNCHKMGHFARECKGPRNQDSKNRYQDSSRRTVHVEETPPKAMVAIDGIESKNANEYIPNVLKEYPNPPLVKNRVSDNKDCSFESPVLVEKNTITPTITKVEVVRPKQQEKPVRKIVSGFSFLLAVATFFTDSGNFFCQWELYNWQWECLGGANGGNITCKGTLKTGKLDFEDVYFFKELKFNLLSVSQMCDKKNSVLFTDTRCFGLSPNFKLADESQVLLKVPRKNNMYSVDMKSIVPKKSITCLVAKVTLDKSMLWHMRLGHINFKNINKLVKDKLVRVLPSKCFENDQTYVSFLKGKQHKAFCKSKI